MSRHLQRGFSLIELAMAVAIAGLVLSGTLTLVTSVQGSGNNRLIAADLQTIGKAVQNYLVLNRTQLLALTALNALGNVEEIRVTDADSGNTSVPSLVGSGALPSTFPVQNINKQNYRILVKRLDDSTAGLGATDMLVGMVYTYGGTSFSDKNGSLVSGNIGAAGGFIYSNDTSNFNGTLGYWQEAVSSWSGSWAAPTAGHVALSTSMLAIQIPGVKGGAQSIDELSDGMTLYSPNKSLYIGNNVASVSSTGSDNTVVGISAALDASGSGSTLVGGGAGGSVMSSRNSYVGMGAGSGTGGTDNVAFGFLSMTQNSSMNKSVAVGNLALTAASSAPAYTVSGSDNVVLGYDSVVSVTGAITLNRVTAIGSFLADIISGADNTLIGSYSAGEVKNLSESTIIGTGTLNGANTAAAQTGNVVVGSSILKAATTNLTFNYNVIISDISACTMSAPTATILRTTLVGDCSTLSSETDQTYFANSKILTTGHIQIVTDSTTSSAGITIGHDTKTYNLTSIAIGWYISDYNSTNGRAVSIGRSADMNTAPEYSVSVGDSAGYTTSGGNNSKLVNFGAAAGASNVSPIQNSVQNTFIGHGAGLGIGSGTQNVIIGSTSGIASGSNNIAIANIYDNSNGSPPTFTDASNKLYLTPAVRADLSLRYVVMGGVGTEAVGGTLTGMTLYVPDGGIQATGYYYTSDRSLKKEIKPLILSASELARFKPVAYRYKAHQDKLRLGFIAQDVDQVLPEVVTHHGDLLGLSYGSMIVPVVSQIQQNEKALTELREASREGVSLEALLGGAP